MDPFRYSSGWARWHTDWHCRNKLGSIRSFMCLSCGRQFPLHQRSCRSCQRWMKICYNPRCQRPFFNDARCSEARDKSIKYSCSGLASPRRWLPGKMQFPCRRVFLGRWLGDKPKLKGEEMSRELRWRTPRPAPLRPSPGPGGRGGPTRASPDRPGASEPYIYISGVGVSEGIVGSEHLRRRWAMYPSSHP